jgi:hypothetical protein
MNDQENARDVRGTSEAPHGVVEGKTVLNRTDAPAGTLAPENPNQFDGPKTEVDRNNLNGERLTVGEHGRRETKLWADVAAGRVEHPGKCPACGRDGVNAGTPNDVTNERIRNESKRNPDGSIRELGSQSGQGSRNPDGSLRTDGNRNPDGRNADGSVRNAETTSDIR